MAMRTPVVESPVKAPEVEPTIAPEIRFDTKIPSREGEVKQLEEGTKEITGGLEEMNKSFEKQAEFAVQNQYEAQLVSAKNQIAGEAKKYQGTNVFAAVKPAQDTFDKATQDISKGITDQRQRDAFNLMAKNYRKSLDNEVGQHVAENVPKAYQLTFGAVMQATMANAKQNFDSPANLKNIEANLERITNQHLEAVGLTSPKDKESADRTRMAIREQYVDTLIGANVDHSKARNASDLLEKEWKDGKVSENFYEKEKDYLKPHMDLADATEIFAGSKDVQGIKGNSKYFGPAGFPKEGAIQSMIQDKYGATKEDPMGGDFERADRVFKQVMNLAKADEDRKQRGRDNSLRAYENAMQTMHEKYVKSGGDPQYDLNHAQNLAIGYKWDMVSQTDMQNKAAAFYAAPTKENPSQARAAESFKVAIHTGQGITNDELQKAYEQGIITPQKLKTLRDENDQFQESGKGGDKQFVLARAKQMFMDYYSDQAQANTAMSQLITETKGMNSLEIQKAAIAHLELVKKAPLKDLTFTTGKTPSGSEIKTISQYQRTFNTIVGSDQTKYLMDSLGKYKPKGETVDMSDLAVFADKFPNGMDDLAVGQPANNAIQSLKAHGERITYDSIRKVIDLTHDGIY